MREVINTVMRDLHVAGDDLIPTTRMSMITCCAPPSGPTALRDLVSSILETNVTIQGNRLNVITKKVTGWAAIIAIPTLITGYLGMNVRYPSFSEKADFDVSVATIVVAGLVLYLVFKRKDWL
jgi:magnesium transporter